MVSNELFEESFILKVVWRFIKLINRCRSSLLYKIQIQKMLIIIRQPKTSPCWAYFGIVIIIVGVIAYVIFRCLLIVHGTQTWPTHHYEVDTDVAINIIVCSLPHIVIWHLYFEFKCEDLLSVPNNFFHKSAIHVIACNVIVVCVRQVD